MHRGGKVRDELFPFLGAVLVPAIAFVALWIPILSSGAFEVDAVFNPLSIASGPVRFFSAVMVLGYAATQVLLPVSLSIDYSFNTFELVEHWHDYRFLVPFVVFLAALILAISRARSQPVLFLSVAMFFGFTFATSNIPALVETIYGERLMYTPATAAALAVGWVFHRLSRLESRLPLRIALGTSVVWMAISCFVIDGRCRAWRNNATLFVHEADANPRSLRLQANAAIEQQVRGEAIGFRGVEGAALLEDWKHYLDRGLAVHERIRHPQALYGLAHYHLVTSEQHRAAKRAEAARRERRIAETYLRDSLASPLLENSIGHRAHLQLALIFGIQGDHPVEREHLKKSLDCDPRVAQSHIRLAEWELQHGEPARAIEIMTEGLRRLPDRIDLRIAAMDIAWTLDDGRAYGTFLAEGEQLHGTNRPILQTYRALLAAREGRYAQAAELFEASLHRLPKTPPLPVYGIFPRVLDQVGRKADALLFLRKNIDRPDLPAFVREEMRNVAAKLGKRQP